MKSQKEIINLVQMGMLNPNSEIGSSLITEEIRFNVIWSVLLISFAALFFWLAGLYKPQQLRHPIDKYRLENKQTFVRAFGWIALFGAIYFIYQLASCFVFPHSVLLESMKEFIE